MAIMPGIISGERTEFARAAESDSGVEGTGLFAGGNHRAVTAASVLHQGKDETIEQTYRVARRWIKAQGYQVTEPNREIYWPDAQAGASSLTEIQFPIFITPKPTSAGS
jgi:GyrI-like small molecule binding protein